MEHSHSCEPEKGKVISKDIMLDGTEQTVLEAVCSTCLKRFKVIILEKDGKTHEETVPVTGSQLQA